MEEPVEHRRSDGGVVEDAPPGRDAQVRRERDRALLVSLADDLEERRGGLGGQGQVAHLVDHEELRAGIEAHRRGPAAFDRGPVAACRELGRSRVVGALAGFDRSPGEGDREHRLANARRPDEEDVRGVLEEAPVSYTHLTLPTIYSV